MGKKLVKERKGLERTNKPVVLPENQTWLKQPTVITLISGDLKNIQTRILISIIEKLQESIEQRTKKIPMEQLKLFTNNNFENKILIDIPFEDFCISPDNYRQLKLALKQLSTIPVELDRKNPLTGEDSWSVRGLFTAYIPKNKYSKRVTIEMEKDIAETFVNVDKGFTKYMKELAYSTQSKYTIRMYMLISSWKDKGGFSINMSKFRKWLKIENKYKNYKDLYKRVIRPVYEELFEKYDCWFEVSEVYDGQTKEPYKLNFKVIKSSLSLKEEEFLNTQVTLISNMLYNHFQLKEKQLKEIVKYITLSNVEKAKNKILYLHEYISKNRQNISNVPEFTKKSLIEELKISEQKL